MILRFGVQLPHLPVGRDDAPFGGGIFGFRRASWKGGVEEELFLYIRFIDMALEGGGLGGGRERLV